MRLTGVRTGRHARHGTSPPYVGARFPKDEDGNRRNVADDEDAARYRTATEDLFEQLDWCIGYLNGIRKSEITKVLAKNRSYIRSEILNQPEEPVPSQATSE